MRPTKILVIDIQSPHLILRVLFSLVIAFSPPLSVAPFYLFFDSFVVGIILSFSIMVLLLISALPEFWV